LERAGASLPVALVMVKARVSKAEARRRLKSSGWSVRKAIG
jgi:hypothetical protein